MGNQYRESSPSGNMAQVKPSATGIHLDSMIRVEPFEILDGREGEIKTKQFFNDVSKFMNSRKVSNTDVVREIVPYLKGRAEIVYKLAKAKRKYAEYNVEYWNPVPETPAVEQVLGENDEVLVQAVPHQPGIQKALRTLLEDLLIKEVNEDTVRNKIRATGRQLQGEPFVEYADRIRLLVFQLHNYTYTPAQKALDVGHTKEFQETMVLISSGTYNKLWDFLIAQGHIEASVRTEAMFQAAIEGSKIWEASVEGRAFLASRQKAHQYGVAAGPVVPTLAQPVGAIAKKKNRLERLKAWKKLRKAQAKNEPTASKPQGGRGTAAAGAACKYCGIKNHLVATCRRKAADVAKGIHKDRCEGYPLLPYYLRQQQQVAVVAKEERSLVPQPVSTVNMSSQDWEEIAQGLHIAQQHADLHGMKCSDPYQQ